MSESKSSSTSLTSSSSSLESGAPRQQNEHQTVDFRCQDNTSVSSSALSPSESTSHSMMQSLYSLSLPKDHMNVINSKISSKPTLHVESSRESSIGKQQKKKVVIHRRFSFNPANKFKQPTEIQETQERKPIEMEIDEFPFDFDHVHGKNEPDNITLITDSHSTNGDSCLDNFAQKVFSQNTLGDLYDDEIFNMAFIYDCNQIPNVSDFKEGPHGSTTAQQAVLSNGVDKNPSQHVTIDIDVKRNGSADQDDNSITTLTNGATKPNEKQHHHHNDNNDRVIKTELKNSLSGQQTSHSQSQRSSVLCRIVLATVGIGILSAIVTLIWYYMGWIFGLPALLIALLVILLTKPGWRWFYIAGATSKRDFIALLAYVKLLTLIKKYEKKNYTIADIFQTNVANSPDKVAIVSETQSWTFRQLNEHSNRVANVFHSHGYKKGDVVGLLLENRPEFVGTWLGLSKIGVITPLINTNLLGPSLLHSITVAKCTALIYGEGFVDAMNDISNEIPSNISLYQFNNEVNKPINGTAKDLTTMLDAAPKDSLAASADRPSHHDKLVYIYTSGTTGLPKAAVISHSRYLFIAAGIHFTLGFQEKDIFYTPLPLYHTAGGIMSMGQALIFGSTVAIRKKFSASGYFADCVKFNCTIAHYIGEMARYILATAPSENDHKHRVRLVFGNGLRPQIWPQFVERFNIPKVGEFYGATEGNANIMNHDSTVGAIGFVSRILPQIYPISIIRADPDSGEPIRGPDGLCQLCKPNEPGVFIGKIIKGNPSREFLGYVDEKASAKKIVCDVFKKGDMAFLSGDLLVADEKGYLYFKDRTGDTFRWKGENVSTSEVEAQVSNVAGYRDTIVYGVTIPNTEGRAGMAAIYDPDGHVDLDKFSENLAKVLPAYARPLILRFLTKIDLTGTFKLRKVDLQKEGFDPNTITDALYYQTPKGKYESLTKDIYDKICRNEMRF